MPTDAKLGLLVGVGLVLAAGVMFFQKDPPPSHAPKPTAAAVKSPAVERPAETSPVPARPVSRTAGNRGERPANPPR